MSPAGSIHLEYDGIESVGYAALATVRGRTVAAIVHHRNESGTYRWSIAGDWEPDPDTGQRPQGETVELDDALRDAADALGRNLEVGVIGWSVKP